MGGGANYNVYSHLHTVPNRCKKYKVLFANLYMLIPATKACSPKELCFDKVTFKVPKTRVLATNVGFLSLGCHFSGVDGRSSFCMESNADAEFEEDWFNFYYSLMAISKGSHITNKANETGNNY